MFDIGFGELVVVAVVALLVVGPERLPRLARDAGRWLHRARQMAASIRNEFEREVNKAEELKNLIDRETSIADLHKQIDETSTSIPAGMRPPSDSNAPGSGAQASSGDAPPAITTTSSRDASSQ